MRRGMCWQAAKKAVAAFESTHRDLQKHLKTTEVECGALEEESTEIETMCAEYAAEIEKIRAKVVRSCDWLVFCVVECVRLVRACVHACVRACVRAFVV